MTDVEARRMASLEARVSRIETMMQELLSILSTSGPEYQRTDRMQTLLQELRNRQGIPTTDITPVAVTPQERLENRAIQEALLAGDNLKAIKLYRELYGVSLQEAAGALRITLHRGG